MPSFRYDEHICTHYPELRAAVILATGLNNCPTTGVLHEQYRAQQEHTSAQILDRPLSELPQLAAWRAAFRRFNVNPTRYRSAPEALLRRLTKKGEIPDINAIVDINNLISIRYVIPVAAFDIRAVNGELLVRSAHGEEQFTPLGSTSVETPDRGDVLCVDRNDLVFARRWCWRQSDQSAARIDTNQVIITIEAMHPGAEEDVQLAARDQIEMLRVYLGGDVEWAFLSPANPAI
jgi:DNA/RNA-binding domain of Phe-tRNA-synthetase-like protein